MSRAFVSARNIVHELYQRYDHPCSFPEGMATLVAPCGRRVKHHDRERIRITQSEVNCMACIAKGADSA